MLQVVDPVLDINDGLICLEVPVPRRVAIQVFLHGDDVLSRGGGGARRVGAQRVGDRTVGDRRVGARRVGGEGWGPIQGKGGPGEGRSKPNLETNTHT